MAKNQTATQEKVETKSDVNPIVRDGFDLEKLRDEYKTKSGVIRYLASQKDKVTGEAYKTGEIAKFMGIIYQHARNVLNQKLKSQAPQPAPTAEQKTESKSKS